MKEIKIKKEINLELGRKMVHFFLVILLTLCFQILEYNLIPLISLALLLGGLLSELCIRGYDIPFVSFSIKKFDRPENILFRPGLGVFTLLLGILTTLFISFIFGFSKIITEVAILMSASDTFSTIFGITFGRHKWFHNTRKTVEGSVAFFLSGIILVSQYFSGWIIYILPIVVALAETIPKFDDNFAISPVALIFLKLVGF